MISSMDEWNAPQRLARRERHAFAVFVAGSVLLTGTVLWIGWSIYSGSLGRFRDGIWIIDGTGNRTEIVLAVIGAAAAGCFYFGRRSAREIERALARRVDQQVVMARAGDAMALAAHKEVWPIYLPIARRWWWVRLVGWLLWFPLSALLCLGLWQLWGQPPETEMRGVALAVLGALLIASLLRFLWVDHPGPKPGPR